MDLFLANQMYLECLFQKKLTVILIKSSDVLNNEKSIKHTTVPTRECTLTSNSYSVALNIILYPVRTKYSTIEINIITTDLHALYMVYVGKLHDNQNSIASLCVNYDLSKIWKQSRKLT